MIKITVLLLSLVPFTLMAQSGPFVIKGMVKNYKEGQKVYLIGRHIRDSTTITKGSFTFSGNVTISNEPDENYNDSDCSIFLDHTGKGINFDFINEHTFSDWGTVYLEPGIIGVKIADSARYVIVTGGRAMHDHLEYDSILTAYHIKHKKWMKDEMQIPEELRKKTFLYDMDKATAAFKNEKKNDALQFVKTHPWSPVSLYILKHSEEAYPEYDQLGPLFEALSPELKNTKFGQGYASMLAGLKLTRLGSIAPAFMMNDENDRPVSLSLFKGKYVLIDFWASWCSPCRQENPNVVKAYKQFKGFNFAILGVSLDEKRDAWIKAIGTDELCWTQVSDLKSWDNAAAKLYAVQAIPQNFLIAPSGKIVAKNLFGVDLIKKLSQIFGSE